MMKLIRGVFLVIFGLILGAGVMVGIIFWICSTVLIVICAETLDKLGRLTPQDAKKLKTTGSGVASEPTSFTHSRN